MAKKYQNIPVSPEVYAKVKMVAGANNRGLGDQVTEWVERELPVCDHLKQEVRIEIFPSPSMLGGTLLDRRGWYCATCKRVYQYASAETPAPTPSQEEAVTS